MQKQQADQRAEKQGRRLPMSERAARTARDEMIIMGRFPNVHVVTFYLLFPWTRGDSSGFSPLEEEKRTKRVKLDAWKRNSERTRARTSVIMGSLFSARLLG